MNEQQTRAQQLMGDIAPKLVELTDDVLFGDVWKRPGLTPRDRSLITVAALVSLYRTDQVASHMRRALDNGLTIEELAEVITHLAFYAGWPCAVSAAVTLRHTVDDHTVTTQTSRPAPLLIQEQGSFAVGGSVITSPGSFDPRHPTGPAGQSLHGDHARVSYQIPVNSRPLPLLLWHGWWEDGSCWDTTPDGREGFTSIFLRRRFPVYVLDQPRRGSAGKTTVTAPVSTTPNEQWFFNQFRLGLWPDLYPGVQFSDDSHALEQFFRTMVPDTGPIDADVLVSGVCAALDRIGPAILVTHSHAGGFGWLTQMKHRNVRAVVSLEPGSGFVFPEGEVPPAMPSSNGALEGVALPLEQFQALTRAPIIVYYGDNIPTEPTDIAGRDNWRVRVEMARLWVEAVNRHGGDAEFVSLPEIGITGNTHFAFSDLNNVQIADQIAAFLAKKGLD